MSRFKVEQIGSQLLIHGDFEDFEAYAEATANWEQSLTDFHIGTADIEAVRWSFEGFRALSEFSG